MVRYCPYCDERMTNAVVEGVTYSYCMECEYVSFPLTRGNDSATMIRAVGKRESSRSRAYAAIGG